MAQMYRIQKDYADKIVQEARDFYHKIRSIYDGSRHSRSYQLGQIWGSGGQNMRDMIGIINSDASAVESIRLSDNTAMFSINPSEPIKEKMVDWYIAYLSRCGHHLFDIDITIQESQVTNPNVCVNRAGRLLTPDFLYRVILCLQIQKYCSIPESRFRIVELGGGCGHLARTLKLFIPNSLYVDIDLPETLYFAYVFLKLNFPHARTCYVTEPSQLRGDGIKEFDFVFIPTIFADCILEHEFDLFCNTASLGEMTNSVIRHWMHFIQNQLKVKYFFGFNRFLNTISLDDEFGQRRLNENECSVLFDANWKILHCELEPPFARSPYEETTVSRNLEIIAERLYETPTKECDNQLRSQQIVEDLMDEAWFRFPDRYIHGTMRSNILSNDLTMSGTLFKLWESIRLYPNKTNVAMMLIYLHTLTRTGCPFEEWFYYKNLFKNLLSSGASENAALYHGVTLLDEKYERLWKRALVLSTSYDTFDIIGFLPSFMRPALIILYRALLSWLASIPYLKKIKRSFTRGLFHA